MTRSCTCWPAGGPPCPDHDTRRSPHCEHGVWTFDDSGDVECCICCDTPCSAVTVEDMRCHRWWDIEHERRLAQRETEDAPF